MQKSSKNTIIKIQQAQYQTIKFRRNKTLLFHFFHMVSGRHKENPKFLGRSAGKDMYEASFAIKTFAKQTA